MPRSFGCEDDSSSQAANTERRAHDQARQPISGYSHTIVSGEIPCGNLSQPIQLTRESRSSMILIRECRASNQLGLLWQRRERMGRLHLSGTALPTRFSRSGFAYLLLSVTDDNGAGVDGLVPS